MMKRFFSRLYTSLRSRASRAAFTLVEMLVVIGISTLVSAAAILYSNTGQNEVALTVETAKVAQLVLQARELALDTYTGTVTSTTRPCAYGVHLDFNSNPQTYSLFAYMVPNDIVPCPSVATVVSTTILSFGQGGNTSAYAPSSWQLPVSQGVALVTPGTATCTHPITDVLFYPPAPTTMIVLINSNNNGGFSSPSPAESSICLQTTDKKNFATITISPEGQVSF
jgi:prepilin-type N-terminal cleavage/methylation domain-containing protein